MDNEKVHSIIRDIVAGGEIIISKHAKGRMRERGYSTHDVEHILLRGEITHKEFKDKTQSWAYTIKGDDLENDQGGVVTVIIIPICIQVDTMLQSGQGGEPWPDQLLLVKQKFSGQRIFETKRRPWLIFARPLL
ncbi:MAG: DUF4258 domain-containing protein [Thermodesulfobacteriota bacterium]